MASVGNVSSSDQITPSSTTAHDNNGNLLYVGVVRDTVTDISGAVVTYDGDQMDLVTGALITATGNAIAVWRKTSPPIGTHNVAVTGLASDNHVVMAVSIIDGDTSTPNDTPVTLAQASGTSISSNIASEVGDIVLQFADANNAGAMTEGAGETEVVDRGNGHRSMCSWKAGAATVTMSVSWTGSARNGHVLINVNAAAGGGGLAIDTTSPLPRGQNVRPYDQQLEASGGTAPYTWAVISGALPSGLTLETDGQLHGTPLTTVGDYNFTVEATDASSATATQALTMNVMVSAGVLYHIMNMGR